MTILTWIMCIRIVNFKLEAKLFVDPESSLWIVRLPVIVTRGIQLRFIFEYDK